jgi:mRNA interferase YafQ
MKLIIRSNRFKRDYKLAIKRQLNLEKLHDIIRLLANDLVLPERCNPHRLRGNYFGYWECHIEPDWLLIYKFDADLLELAATGTHADLFR